MDELKRKIMNVSKEILDSLAEDAREKMCNQYERLIDFYYADYSPKLDDNGIPYYIRTFNLYKSYSPYKKVTSQISIFAGIRIHGDKMRDYDSVKGYRDFKAEDLLFKFIVPVRDLSRPDRSKPYYTVHGGDWHGGYGKINSFNIYDEMIKYRDKLASEYSKMNIQKIFTSKLKEVL